MGKGVSDLICHEKTVYIMPWNFSAGLKSDAPPRLCAVSSLPASYIFEVFCILILPDTKIYEHFPFKIKLIPTVDLGLKHFNILWVT